MAKAQLEIVLTDAGGTTPSETEMERRAPVVTGSQPATPAPQSTPATAPKAGDTQPVSTSDTQVVTPSAPQPTTRQPETTGQAAWMAAKEIAAETSMGRLVATIDRLWTKLQRAADMLNPQRLEVPQRQATPTPSVTAATTPEPSEAFETADAIPPVQQTDVEPVGQGAIQTAATVGRTATEVASAAETTAATTGAAATGTAAGAATTGAVAGETVAATGAVAAGAAAATGLLAVGAAVGAVVAGFGLAAMASKSLSNALEAQASTMASYSASVADATAATELSREAANIRRADALGPDLSEFERERAAIGETMADAMTSIYRVMLVIWNVLEPVVSIVATTIVVISKSLEAQVLMLNTIIAFFTQGLDAAKKSWANAEKAAKQMFDAIKGNNDDDPLDNSFANQFKGLGQAMADRNRPGKRKANGGDGMGNPMFIPDKNRR